MTDEIEDLVEDALAGDFATIAAMARQERGLHTSSSGTSAALFPGAGPDLASSAAINGESRHPKHSTGWSTTEPRQIDERKAEMKLPKPTTIIAIAALIVAVTGSAGAATYIISGKQIRPASITGRQIKNKSLTRADFRGSVRGPAGADGDTGPQGLQGPPGPPGIASSQVYDGPAASQCPAGAGGCQVAASAVTCPNGGIAVSGGYVASNTTNETITYDRIEPPSTFAVVAVNYDTQSGTTIQARVFCAYLNASRRRTATTEAPGWRATLRSARQRLGGR